MADLPRLLHSVSHDLVLSKVAESEHPTESSSGQAVEDERVCRICLGAEPVEELFRPCLCKGTMQCVHKGCLQQWRLTSSNRQSYFRCEHCQYSYNIRRVFLADLLAEPWLPQAFALLMMVSCITACTCLAVKLWGHNFGPRLWWLQATGAGTLLFGILAFIFIAFVDAEVAGILKTICALFKRFLAEARPTAEHMLSFALQLLMAATVGLTIAAQASHALAFRTSRAVIGMLGESVLNVDDGHA